MIVGVDGNEANVKQKVGVSVYAANLLAYWSKKANSNLRFKIFLKEKPQSNLPPPHEFFNYETVAGDKLWSQIFLPARLNLKKDIDVFFSPAHYSPRLSPVPVVVTIHDLSYFYYPGEFLKKDLYKLENWTKYSVQKAKRVIAVSQNTKKDLLKFYRLPVNKVEVIYNGYEKQKTKTAEQLKNFDLPKAYFLYVGTLQPRKNVSTLIRAFRKFKQTYPLFKLIIVGRKGWLYQQIFSLVTNLNLEEEIIFTDYVTDAELVKLYQNAFCFVLPSLYEGFGIPILEAMAYACPVISSNVSSLPEIGGQACLYFNPHSEKELLTKMKILANNQVLRQQLIKKGKEQIKNFSWQKCAEETLKVIQSTL